MNKIITRLKRYSCLLLCLCLLMPLLQGTAAAVQDSSVVRVAWYPDSAYNITCENGETQRLWLRISAVRRRIYRLDL